MHDDKFLHGALHCVFHGYGVILPPHSPGPGLCDRTGRANPWVPDPTICILAPFHARSRISVNTERRSARIGIMALYRAWVWPGNPLREVPVCLSVVFFNCLIFWLRPFACGVLFPLPLFHMECSTLAYIGSIKGANMKKQGRRMYERKSDN